MCSCIGLYQFEDMDNLKVEYQQETTRFLFHLFFYAYTFNDFSEK